MAQFYHAAALCNESLHEKHVLDIDKVQEELDAVMWPTARATVPRGEKAFVEEAVPLDEVPSDG